MRELRVGDYLIGTGCEYSYRKTIKGKKYKVTAVGRVITVPNETDGSNYAEDLFYNFDNNEENKLNANKFFTRHDGTILKGI